MERVNAIRCGSSLDRFAVSSWMPFTYNPGGSLDIKRLLLRRGLARRCGPGIALTSHQIVDDLLYRRPVGLAEVVVAHDERRAGIEFLILLVAAGEFRADHVPGQLEQF